MKKEEITEKFYEFLDEFYKEELITAVTEDKKSIKIDFSELDKFDVELADYLLENPEETMTAAEEAIKRIDTGLPEAKLRVRVKNLPESKEIRIRNIRARHIGKLIAVDGIVKRASEVRPEISEAIFSCPNCGNNISVMQTGKKLKKPIACECGRKKGFRLVDQKLYDVRWVAVEEPFEITTGERPSEIMIVLKQDLTSPKMQNRTDPGNRIKIVGVLKKRPRKRRGKSRQMDIYIEANYVEPVEVEWEELEITEEDEQRILELAKDPTIYQKLVNSVAPTIYGNEEIKEAIILQMFGGEPHLLPDGTRIRGNIHVLLVGDPASGKCLEGDADVILSDGRIKKIKDIVENGMKNPQEIDDGYFATTNHKVPSFSNEGKIKNQKATILWKRKAPEFIYEIETETGIKLKTTPTHPFLTINDGDIIYKRAQNLSPSDFISTARQLPIKGSKQKIDFKIKRKKGTNEIILPKTITPEFGRFLGYLLGEGSVREENGRVSFTNQDPQLLKDFKECSKKVFGDLHISEIPPRKGKNATDLFIYSTSLVNFLKELEPNLLEGSAQVVVPEIVLKSENECVKELLKGLFEGEVTIKKDARSMELTSASEELIKQLRILLLRFGICSQTHPRTGKATNSKMDEREYYRLRVSGINFEKFYKKIGFITTRRKNKAKEVLKAKRHTNIDTIPSLSNLLKGLRKKLRLTQFDMGIPRTTYQHFERGDRNPTRWRLKEIVEALKNRIDEIKRIKRGLDKIGQKDLKEIRNRLYISQLELADLIGVSQTLISHYELGKIKLSSEQSRKTFEKIKMGLYEICIKMLDSNLEIDKLEFLSNSGILWDKIIRLKKAKAKEKWVYDLQVDKTHNFVANNVIVHNSKLMQLASRMIPRGKYVSGRGVTAAGLTASVVRDEQFLGGWVLEAGALVMSNKSMCSIDEFSKVSPQDQVALQEAMSLGTISIAKASIVATLPAQTAVLAGGNPKLGRFDPYIPVREQIAIGDVLLSRFDLRFALRDVPNPDVDAKMAEHILEMRHFKEERAKPAIDPELLRKYIAYARANIHPKLTEEAGEKIKDFYLEMREKAGGEAPVSITLRQYEALIRLAEASAKVRLSEQVELEDAIRAINLMKVSLRQFGFEPETGKIDIDRAEGYVTAAQRSKIRVMLDVIEALSEEYGKDIPQDEIIERAREQGIENAEEMLRKMLREGMLYSPKSGFVQKIG